MIALWLTAALADEVVVWHTWRGAEQDGLQAAVARWEQQTGHAATLVPLPFGAFESKAETAVPRGNGPDVLLWGHGVVGKWSTMGVIDPTECPLEGQRAVTVEALTWDGRVWGAPLAYKSLVLLYDPERVPAPPTSTDELVQIAHEQTGGGRYGVAWQAAEAYYLAPFLHAFGGHAIDASGHMELDDAGHVAALGFVRRLAVDERVAPQQPTAELVGRLYDEGDLAMVISGPWFVADRARPIAAAPLPTVDRKSTRLNSSH